MCQDDKSLILSVKELDLAEKYWIKLVQQTHFTKEISLLKKNKTLPKGSCLITLHPFIDSEGILRLSGRIGNSNRPYEQVHPIILHCNHQITKMIITAEHLCLLHAGPTMLTSSICVRFHIIGGKRVIRYITRACVTCCRYSVRPQPQLMGQLPIERVTPGPIFERVGVDYASPIIQYNYTIALYETDDLIEKTKISVRKETLLYSLSHSNGVCHSDLIVCVILDKLLAFNGS